MSLGIIIQCIHRLTTTVWINANTFWSKWYLVVYLGVLVVSGLATSLMNYRELTYDYEKKMFVAIPLPVETSQASWRVLRISTIAYLITVLTLGIATYLQVRKKLFGHSDHQKAILRRLSYMTIINATVFVVLLSWQFLAAFVSFNVTVDILVTVTDVGTFSFTFIVVFLDKNMRTIIKNHVTVAPVNQQVARGNTVT